MQTESGLKHGENEILCFKRSLAFSHCNLPGLSLFSSHFPFSSRTRIGQRSYLTLPVTFFRSTLLSCPIVLAYAFSHPGIPTLHAYFPACFSIYEFASSIDHSEVVSSSRYRVVCWLLDRSLDVSPFANVFLVATINHSVFSSLALMRTLPKRSPFARNSHFYSAGQPGRAFRGTIGVS